MQINAINNVSFSRRKPAKEQEQQKSATAETAVTIEPKKKDKTQYYTWVSQNQVNRELKMSVNREAENGKYQAASGFSKLGGLLGMTAALFTGGKALSLSRAAQTAEGLKSKADKNAKVAVGLAIASTAAIYASTVIDAINSHKADKTAEERGFLTTKQMNKIKKVNDAYTITNEIYKKHVM